MESLSGLLNSWSEEAVDAEDADEDDGYDVLFQEPERIVTSQPSNPIKALQSLLSSWQPQAVKWDDGWWGASSWEVPAASAGDKS